MAKTLYCKHQWEIGDCGHYQDCWRYCDRCDTKWWPLREVFEKPWFWDFIFGRPSHGIYGKEPKVILGVVK